MFNRAEVVDRQLTRFLAGWAGQRTAPPDSATEPKPGGSRPTDDDLLELFESQITARHLDLIARRLRAADQGYYTIGSAGHEGNAVIGRLTRHTDPAFLHYRSAALMAERARKVPGQTFIRDTLLSLVASREEPISGGRHKVWGSRALWVPPQTSTIGSHPPKAVGMALALARAHRLKTPLEIPHDSIIICSFGDATTHHSTTQGAINAALFAVHRHMPAPILFVCEDNSLGISVPTPPDWIATAFGNRPGLQYIPADGLDIAAAYEATAEAVRSCRQRRRPVFLHLKVVRLLGHAGSDMEASYRSLEAIEQTEARDPLLATARTILELGAAAPEQLLARYEQMRWHMEREAGYAASRPKLGSAAEVVASLAPHSPDRVEAEARRAPDDETRRALYGGRLPEESPPRHMAVQLNRALIELMAQHEPLLIFGEDVSHKGGVYHLTAGLLDRFGPGRVFNTILDEQTILGLAQGFGALGMLPVPEIQYLAYVHNAEDQLRGEACSLQFFSSDQFRNPMVVRIASFGYQKGFGGHFHNDNSIAALRDIPGLVIAAPSRGDDAVKMLRTALALARVDGRVVAFLEPIALYMTRDLHTPGDGQWLTAYPPPGEAIPVGEGRVYNAEATDLAIITYANGVFLSLRAARLLEREHGIRARVVDLRWLNPLDEALIAEQARECRAVLVVDEGRRSGGVAEAVIATLVDGGRHVPPIARVTGADTYIPLGPAARLVLPDVDDIIAGGAQLCYRDSSASPAE